MTFRVSVSALQVTRLSSGGQQPMESISALAQVTPRQQGRHHARPQLCDSLSTSNDLTTEITHPLILGSGISSCLDQGRTAAHTWGSHRSWTTFWFSTPYDQEQIQYIKGHIRNCFARDLTAMAKAVLGGTSCYIRNGGARVLFRPLQTTPVVVSKSKQIRPCC